MNPNGGTMAMGHAFGATGAILVGSCIEELERRDGRYGVAAVSGAAGLGVGRAGRAGGRLMDMRRRSALALRKARTESATSCTAMADSSRPAMRVSSIVPLSRRSPRTCPVKRSTR